MQKKLLFHLCSRKVQIQVRRAVTRSDGQDGEARSSRRTPAGSRPRGGTLGAELRKVRGPLSHPGAAAGQLQRDVRAGSSASGPAEAAAFA